MAESSPLAYTCDITTIDHHFEFKVVITARYLLSNLETNPLPAMGPVMS